MLELYSDHDDIILLECVAVVVVLVRGGLEYNNITY